MELTELYKNRLKVLSGIIADGTNIRPHGRYEHMTLNAPIIPDGIELLSRYPDAVKFDNKIENDLYEIEICPLFIEALARSLSPIKSIWFRGDYEKNS